MTYELAKQLKEAGFPQEGRGYWIEESNVSFEEEPSGAKHLVYAYAPILEELIEACGKTFLTLTKTGHGGSDAWRTDELGQKEIYGSTPTEAGARLWLALNAK